MNEVAPGVFIGGYPTKEDVKSLHCLDISSILTIDVSPLPDDFVVFNKRFLHLRDEPTEDLLPLLEDALSFIEKSRRIGNVLVHCSAGISRSAAIVIAYIMRQKGLSYEEAFAEISKQRAICPNVGFINQLKLFHIMGWRVDTNCASYRQYVADKKFRGAYSVYAPPPMNLSFKSQDTTPSVFRCRKCRFLAILSHIPIPNVPYRCQLFTTANLVWHYIPQKEGSSIPATRCAETTENKIVSKAILLKGVSWNCGQIPCASGEIFCEPLDWTRSYTHEVEGKLYCPTCSTKLGSFNWCGVPCACGSWVTPAFHFSQGRVDRISPKGQSRPPIGDAPFDSATASTGQEELQKPAID